ncbi:hypothetical protein IAT40_007507 [Kwoniella sp. CBS 6097]
MTGTGTPATGMRYWNSTSNRQRPSKEDDEDDFRKKKRKLVAGPSQTHTRAERESLALAGLAGRAAPSSSLTTLSPSREQSPSPNDLDQKEEKPDFSMIGPSYDDLLKNQEEGNARIASLNKDRNELATAKNKAETERDALKSELQRIQGQSGQYERKLKHDYEFKLQAEKQKHSEVVRKLQDQLSEKDQLIKQAVETARREWEKENTEEVKQFEMQREADQKELKSLRKERIALLSDNQKYKERESTLRGFLNGGDPSRQERYHEPQQQFIPQAEPNSEVVVPASSDKHYHATQSATPTTVHSGTGGPHSVAEPCTARTYVASHPGDHASRLNTPSTDDRISETSISSPTPVSNAGDSMSAVSSVIASASTPTTVQKFPAFPDDVRNNIQALCNRQELKLRKNLRLRLTSDREPKGYDDLDFEQKAIWRRIMDNISDTGLTVAYVQSIGKMRKDFGTEQSPKEAPEVTRWSCLHWLLIKEARMKKVNPEALAELVNCEQNKYKKLPRAKRETRSFLAQKGKQGSVR